MPEIAFGHHEKLNGVGYPRGIRGEEIPVQTRMMTISDIYDALTATDRPYKPAVPLPKALDILRMETKGGMIDADLVELFVSAKVYEATRLRRAEGAPYPPPPGVSIVTTSPGSSSTRHFAGSDPLVQQVPPTAPVETALRTRGRARAALGEQRDRAPLQHAVAPHHAVAAAMLAARRRCRAASRTHQ